MTRQMTGAEMVVQALIDQGVEHLFGYPGGAVLPIYDELFQQDKVCVVAEVAYIGGRTLHQERVTEMERHIRAFLFQRLAGTPYPEDIQVEAVTEADLFHCFSNEAGMGSDEDLSQWVGFITDPETRDIKRFDDQF